MSLESNEPVEFYRVLFDINPLPMWLFDEETLAFVEVNGSAIKHYGYSREEFLSMTLKEIRPEEDIPVLFQVLSTNPPGTGRFFSSGVRRHRKKNGEIIFSEILWCRISIADRKLKLVVIRDVTEEKKIKEDQARLHEILSTAFDLIAYADNNMKMLFVNPAGRRMLGLSDDEEVTNLQISDYHPQWVYELITQKGIPHAAKYGMWTGETVLLTRDGREIPIFQVIMSHKSATGKIEIFSTIAKDISNQKQADARLKDTEMQVREKNIALREVLHQLEIDKKEMKNRLDALLEKSLFPLLRSLKKNISQENVRHIEIIEKNLDELLHQPADSHLSVKLPSLAPRELEICNLIRNGLESREIARILKTSLLTVETQRNKIRKKLGLSNKSVSLAVYLKNI
ncbi:MAG: PAS domain S-box protein [Candidatus Omnitrophica bacterium]|nr:PAS domain S-box protein [Candidatus Omnitrophota bacterium]